MCTSPVLEEYLYLSLSIDTMNELQNGSLNILQDAEAIRSIKDLTTKKIKPKTA
jgi:hypothetical protein